MGQERDVDDDMSSPTLRISIHIRCPENYCDDGWKQANSISHPIRTMKEICRCLESLPVKPKLKIDVYTEDTFTMDREHRFRRRLESFLPVHQSTNTTATRCVHIHRQTPLLDTVRGMATADIFVPASSYLSAMAAYFSNALVVLADEDSRRTQYFAPHLQDECPTRVVPVQDTPALAQALTTLCQTKGVILQGVGETKPRS